MKKKVSFGETLFARIFNIVAGKEYLVSVQWDARRGSRFFPLSLRFKKLFLSCAGVVTLGLLCLLGECGNWLHREINLQYHFKKNAALKHELGEVLTEQKSVE